MIRRSLLTRPITLDSHNQQLLTQPAQNTRLLRSQQALQRSKRTTTRERMSTIAVSEKVQPELDKGLDCWSVFSPASGHMPPVRPLSLSLVFFFKMKLMGCFL
jgi:hypothetical protein